MTDLIKLNQEFEGKPLTTIFYRNRPCWIAREVGQAVGYARGGERLVTKITNEWNEEFIDGHDYIVIAGEELADFKALLQLHTDSVGSRAKHLLLLFEPGLHLTLAKTNKPVGRRLRRFIADEVLPQIARDGAYLPERTVEEAEISGAELRKLEVEEAREARLDRELQSSALSKLVDWLKISGMYSKETIATYEIAAAEAATGKSYPLLKPTVQENWYSPTEIAERYGVTSQKVGRIITKLGYRGLPGKSRAILNKAVGCDRTVTSYLYNREVLDQIGAELLKF